MSLLRLFRAVSINVSAGQMKIVKMIMITIVCVCWCYATLRERWRNGIDPKLKPFGQKKVLGQTRRASLDCC